MAYKRLLDKSNKQTHNDIENWLGETADLWKTILDFISQNYDFNKELAFFLKITVGQ